MSNSLKDAGTYTLIQIASFVFLPPFLQAVFEAIYWLFTGNLFNYSLNDLLGLESLNQVTTMIGLNKIINLALNTWITIPPFVFLMIVFYLSPLYDARVKQKEKPNLEQFLDFRRSSDVHFSDLNGRIDNLEYLIKEHHSLTSEIQRAVFKLEDALVELNSKIGQIEKSTDLLLTMSLSLDEIKLAIDVVEAKTDTARQLDSRGLDEIAY